MNVKILYTSILIILLTALKISANQPLYVNGEEIPIHLAAIARNLLNVSANTIIIKLEPSKFEELKIVLAQYERIVNPKGKVVAINKDHWVELQKKILP